LRFFTRGAAALSSTASSDKSLASKLIGRVSGLSVVTLGARKHVLAGSKVRRQVPNVKPALHAELTIAETQVRPDVVIQFEDEMPIARFTGQQIAASLPRTRWIRFERHLRKSFAAVPPHIRVEVTPARIRPELKKTAGKCSESIGASSHQPSMAVFESRFWSGLFGRLLSRIPIVRAIEFESRDTMPTTNRTFERFLDEMRSKNSR